MKLGIISGYFAEDFRKAKEWGLEAIELCMNVGTDIDALEAETDRILRDIRETGVVIGSVGRWGGARIDEKGEFCPDELQIARRLIDFCAKVGCPVYVTGVKYVPERTYAQNLEAAIRFFKTLCEYGGEKGVKIAAYNCRWDNFVCEDKVWEVVLSAVPELGIKFDPSHSYYAGEDYLFLMQKWGKRFYHVHIKGALKINGERVDDPPAGMDQIDWRSFMALLYFHGYDGVLSLEPHSSTRFGDRAEFGIEFSARHIRQFLPVKS